MTPIFPKEAKHQAMQAEDKISTELAQHRLRQFVEMAERQGPAFFYFDERFVKLPPIKSSSRKEHVRGLERDIWASTHPRIPGGMAR